MPQVSSARFAKHFAPEMMLTESGFVLTAAIGVTSTSVPRRVSSTPYGYSE